MKNWILSKSVQKSKLEMPDWAYTHLTKPKTRAEDSGPNTNAKSMPKVSKQHTKVH